MRQQAYHAEPSQAQSQSSVLPFRQRVGPWIRQSSLSRGANRLCSILISHVLQNGPRAGATLAFAPVEKLRELMNRHRSQHERPVKKRTVERYLAEAIAAGFVSRESSNRRRDRRARATRGVWLRIHFPEHDSAQPTESEVLAGKNGGNEPSARNGGFEPPEMAETVHEMAETSPHTLRDPRDLRERGRGESKGAGDLPQAEPDPSRPMGTEVQKKEPEAEAIEAELVHFAREVMHVRYLPHDPPDDAASRRYRLEHIAARLAEGYTEADLMRGIFLACGDGFARAEGLDVVKHTAKRLPNYLSRDRGRARARAGVLAEALIGFRS